MVCGSCLKAGATLAIMADLRAGGDVVGGHPKGKLLALQCCDK